MHGCGTRIQSQPMEPPLPQSPYLIILVDFSWRRKKNRQRCQKPLDSAAVVGAADEGAVQGGCGYPDLGIDLFGGGPVGHAVLVRYMVHDPLHWEGVGWIPPHWERQTEKESTLAGKVICLDLPPSGGRNAGGGNAGGGDLRLPTKEHSCTVYCDEAHYGPVSGGRSDNGFKGDQGVAEAGYIVCGGDVEGGLVGGIDGGEGGDGRYGDGYRLSWWKYNAEQVTLGT